MVISTYFSLDFPKNIGKKSEEMEKKKKKRKKLKQKREKAGKKRHGTTTSGHRLSNQIKKAEMRVFAVMLMVRLHVYKTQTRDSPFFYT